MIPRTRQELAAMIDHTLLNPTAVRADIEALCREAAEYQFASVCVLPKWVSLAAERLRGTGVKVCSVAGFPLGAVSPRIKALEAEEVIMAGADEVDMVADLAAILESEQGTLHKDVAAAARVCKAMKPRVPLKVIIESAALTDAQIVFACKVVQGAGADFIKTSTGMLKAGGATVEAVRLMKESAPYCKIKAAGGIRTALEALAMLEAGADRIGTSASVQIVEGFAGNAGV